MRNKILQFDLALVHSMGPFAEAHFCLIILNFPSFPPPLPMIKMLYLVPFPVIKCAQSFCDFLATSISYHPSAALAAKQTTGC